MKIQFLFFIFFLLTLQAIASDDKKHEVDSLLKKTKELLDEGQLLPHLKTAIEALNLANAANYDDGKAKSRFYLAEGLVNLGLFKEGLKHLELIKLTNHYKEKVLMQSEVHRVRGRAYGGLNLYRQALTEFRLQLGLIKNLTGLKQKLSYQYTYENLSVVFDHLEQLDSVEKYAHLQLKNLQDVDEKKEPIRYMIVYDDLSKIYFQKKDFEQAQRYSDKALALVKKYKIPVFFNTMTHLGNLELEKGNYKQAVFFYEKSLENERKIGLRSGVKNSYRLLADCYREGKLDKAKAEQYEMAFTRLSDSLENENKEVVDQVLSMILKLKDQESDTKVSKSVTVSVIILAVLIIAIAFFVWRVRHNRRLLGQKEEELQETEILNKELTEQIGENKFNNLIDLAKSNNPEFLTLFAELYPQFIQALKTFDPNIRTTELEFCAMAFLNFSTKNIAEYTFVTVRAVQVRKNRLRKKLEIPSDADFNTWMRGLAEKEDK